MLSFLLIPVKNLVVSGRPPAADFVDTAFDTGAVSTPDQESPRNWAKLLKSDLVYILVSISEPSVYILSQKAIAGQNSCAAGYVTLCRHKVGDSHITTTTAAAHCAKTAKI